MTTINFSPPRLGKAIKFQQGVIEAAGLNVETGTLCEVFSLDRPDKTYLSEVIGFDNQRVFLMPFQQDIHVKSGTLVRSLDKTFSLTLSSDWLGKIVDGQGLPLVGEAPSSKGEIRSIKGTPINPMQRKMISEPLDVGVRSINSLLTIAKGQRIGLMAGSGVGKSVLLGMMARYTSADVVVLAFVGERGREVFEFIEHNLAPEIRHKTVVVAVPADRSPLERVHGAYLAMTIAEYFRDQGKDVLLMMDSLTRFAMAQREISISLGEFPATRGYSSTVFRMIPQLVERAGNGTASQGSITGIYTVLAEGDDQQDPIVDCARAILDGHIVLSRELAAMGHYPAINIAHSISRCQVQVLNSEQMKISRAFRQHWSSWVNHQELVKIGAYRAGSDPILDAAIKKATVMEKFLKQEVEEKSDLLNSFSMMEGILR